MALSVVCHPNINVTGRAASYRDVARRISPTVATGGYKRIKPGISALLLLSDKALSNFHWRLLLISASDQRRAEEQRLPSTG